MNASESWIRPNLGMWVTLKFPKYQMWKSKNDVVEASREGLCDSGSSLKAGGRRMKGQVKGVDEN